MSDIDPLANRHYRPQWHLNDVSRKQIETFFKGNISDKEVHEYYDGFINFIRTYLSDIFKHAIEEQKKRDEEEKKNG